MSAFRIEPRDRGIVHLVMDHPTLKVNVLDEAALASLEERLAELEAMPALRGVVVTSARSGSFIAGADVHQIAAITDRDAVVALVRRAHATFSRLAALRAPTVAAIDGVCLGGGAELALACDSRVAAQEPRTQIGFPEVMLGLLPGFGGTTRLPRLIGLTAALDLLLTGRSLDARRAERAGLVARAVPAAWLLDHAERRLDELAKRPAGARRDRYRPRGVVPWLIDSTPPGRALALSRARAMTLRRTAGHYPAPLAILQVLEHGLGRSVDESLALEVPRAADLVTGEVCKNLVRIFLLSEHARKAPVADPAIAAAPVRVLALAGAGVMGGGIAELASRSGIEVRLRDVRPESLTRALETVDGLIEERVRRRRASKAEAGGQRARIFPTLDLTGIGRADFAMEAVVEDLDVKRRVFAELEVRMRPEAVLATNTSSLSVDALAAGLERPERFCGFHFFNPVHRMPLVEVVRGARTSDHTLVTAVTLARRLGKTPVVVNDGPGFVVNRLLMPYLREAMHLLEEGFTLPDLDAAMRAFGMPMGPFEVVDEVGLDVAARVAKILGAAFPERMAPAPLLDRLLADGRLGRKNGRGFYRHAGGRRTPDPDVPRLLESRREPRRANRGALAERMMLAMVNEGARVVEDRVVDHPDRVDVAMIFGAGFPPFRGGPMRWADGLGLPAVVSRLTALKAEKGARFEPAPLLLAMAESGAAFTARSPDPVGTTTV